MRRWTLAEIETVRSMYPEAHTADIAALLGRTLSQVYNKALGMGLHKSSEYLASDAAARIQRGKQHPNMIASRIKPGTPPWNKGRKGVNGYSATRFKPGALSGAAAKHIQKIGAERINADGVLDRKVNATGHRETDWQSVHSLVWIAAHGPVPAGHVVVFKPGMKTTDADAITPDKLECLSRAELMQRNSYHNKYPPEVTKLVQLKGAITRQVNRISRESANQGIQA